MATKVDGQEIKSQAVKADAATANSIPDLRDQVVKLAEAVEELEKRLENAGIK